ncbi:MAG: GatB/YqeY domain-containing protein [Firmicutes bacterium]|nr:GatB/YqeY domain-containing protein [Bacillota bacterium]
MSLKQALFDGLKEAMKNKDTAKKEVIQMVRAGVLQIEKDSHIDELDDQGVSAVISKEIKKLKDVIPDFKQGGREDLVEEAEKKIAILTAYLPEQLSEDEIKQIISQAISECGAGSMKDMGKVMSAVTAKTAGRADNKIVSGLVRAALQNL